MTKAVIIVGVDHIYQYKSKWFAGEIEKFESYLESVIKQYNIDLLAEEFSKELVVRNDSKFSTLEIVAGRTKKRHIFCDPDEQTQIKLGIKGDKDGREKIWLKKILEEKEDVVLFICGRDHVNTFVDKIENEGHEVHVLKSDWGEDFELKS